MKPRHQNKRPTQKKLICDLQTKVDNQRKQIESVEAKLVNANLTINGLSKLRVKQESEIREIKKERKILRWISGVELVSILIAGIVWAI